MSILAHPRIESAIVAFHGTPRDVLEGIVDKSVRNALSEDQQGRLSTALSEVICVYPDRQGRYTVHSQNSEHGAHTKYSVDLKYSNAKTCTCSDYMFRCDPESGQMCKHLWRTNLLINIGALPETTANPYDWLLDELVRDKNLLMAMEADIKGFEKTPSQRMADLIKKVDTTHRIAVDYPRICTMRATILKSIYADV